MLDIRKIITNMLIIIFLTSCAPTPKSTLLNTAHGIRKENVEKVSGFFGSPVKVVFTIENDDINILSGTTVKKSDNDSGKEKASGDRELKLGCIKISDKENEVCKGYIDSEVFKIDKIHDPVSAALGVAIFTAVLPITAVVDTKNVGRNVEAIGNSVVEKQFDPEVAQDIAALINYKIYKEYKDFEASYDLQKMNAFVKKFPIEVKDSRAHQLLISVYRKQNNFECYMKAFDETNAEEDLQAAYRVAVSDYQRSQVEYIVKEREERKQRALLGAALGAAAIFSFGKWIAGAVGSALSSSSSYNTSSSGSMDYSQTVCHSGDVCFEVIGTEDNVDYRIRCTKGSDIGAERKICKFNKTTEKWAANCGWSTVNGFHYKSYIEAGNATCN